MLLGAPFTLSWAYHLASSTSDKMQTRSKDQNTDHSKVKQDYLFVIISLQDTDSVTNSLKLSFVTIMPPVLSAKCSRNLWLQESST